MVYSLHISNEFPTKACNRRCAEFRSARHRTPRLRPKPLSPGIARAASRRFVCAGCPFTKTNPNADLPVESSGLCHQERDGGLHRPEGLPKALGVPTRAAAADTFDARGLVVRLDLNPPVKCRISLQGRAAIQSAGGSPAPLVETHISVESVDLDGQQLEAVIEEPLLLFPGEVAASGTILSARQRRGQAALCRLTLRLRQPVRSLRRRGHPSATCQPPHFLVQA